MSRCEHFQAELLEHLFGLLEADHSLALIEHAGQCEDCRAALLKADLQKKLLGAAAKSEFAGLRFEEPAPDIAAEGPRVVKLSRPHRQIDWRRWAVAAGIFLAVSSLAVPAAVYGYRFFGAQRQFDAALARLDNVAKEQRDLQKHHDEEITRADKASRVVEDSIATLAQKQAAEIRAARESLAKKDLMMVVKGPGTIRSGATTTYTIDTLTQKGEKAPARLDAIVRDTTTNRVIFEKKDIHSDGSCELVLASDVAIKGGTGLALELVATSAEGVRGELKERLALAQASYATHLYTDKALYQPGETVHWRSLTLDRFTLKPATDDLRLVYTLTGPQGNQIFQYVRVPRLLDAEGREVLGPDRKPIRGIGADDWKIPTDFSGGEYVLEVREVLNRFPSEKRKFVVNRYSVERLHKEIKLDKEAYGLGSAVVAHVKVSKAEGSEALAFQPVGAVVRVDGDACTADGRRVKDVNEARIRLKTDENGEADVKFTLPKEIEKGDVTLSVEFTDGASNEVKNRPLNVVVGKMHLEFFPEGGDLVAGAANRVYFQARSMLDKPAAVKAVLVDETGKTIVDDIRTLNDPKEQGINQGTGKFSFTPEAGKKYQVKVVEPAGIKSQFFLPPAVADSVALSVPSGVTNDQQAIDVVVQSMAKDRELLIGVYCRGRLLDFQEMTAKAGEATRISLKPKRDVGGVYRVTVFDKLTMGAGRQQLKPVAERLIYRQPTDRLNLAVESDKRTYLPGDWVKLRLKADNEGGKGAPSILMLGVVDKQVVNMADERTARTMPTHFLLTSEVRRADELEFVDVLLGQHAKAAEALDLLLGTQGWRRFLESDPQRLQQQKNKQAKTDEERLCKADVDRLFVALGKMTDANPQKTIDTYELRHKQIVEKYAPQFEDAEVALARSDEKWQEAVQGVQFDAQRRTVQNEADQARKSYAAALLQLRDYESLNGEIRSRALLAFGLVLLIAGAGSLVIAVTRNLPRAVPFFGTAVAAVAVCALVLLGTFFFDSQIPDQAGVALRSERSERAVKTAALAEDKPMAEGAAWRQANDPGAPEQDGARPQERAHALREARAAAKGEGKGGGGGMMNEKENQRAGPGFGVRPAKPGDAMKRNKDDRAAGPANLMPRMPAAVPAPAPGVLQMVGQGQQKADEKAKIVMAAAAPGHNGAMVADGKGMPAAKKQNGMQYRRGAQNEQNRLLGRLDGANRAEPFAGQPMPDANRDMDALQLRARKNLQEEALERADKDFKKAAEQAKNPAADRALANVRRQLAQQQLALAEPCYLREYAHNRLVGPDPDLRTDFTETLFWTPAIVLPNGTGEVTFQLCDSVSTFQVVAFGHSVDGRLGACTAEFESKKLFNINGVLPQEVTATDIIDFPVAVENASAESRTIAVRLSGNGLALVAGTEGNSERLIQLKSKERTRVIFRVKPTIKEGTAYVKVKGSTEPFGTDAVQYAVNVVPEGFPTVAQVSDVLEGGANFDVAMPEAKYLVKGTLKAKLQVYPSTLADLQKGLEGLLREPNGCFEQTSTTNYPNVLILSYLQESHQANPQLEQKARGLLERGYGRLVSFECLNQGKQQREGYEWFGGSAPAHEALTAYGLLQFLDMQRIGFPVDNKMIQRTRDWLMSRRDGKGGFQRNGRALDTFGRAPDHITNAYIVWAITESEGPNGPSADLDKEIAALQEQAKTSEDPYFLSLIANSLLNRGKTEPALDLLHKLAKLQKKEGQLCGTQTSITGSGGRTLEIETTALAVLAWTKANRPQDFHGNLTPAIKWIGQQRGGYGGFGSTQSTILALKALLAFTKAKPRAMEPGELKLTINGKAIGTQPFGADLKETLTINVPDAENFLKAGKNEVEIGITGKTVLPFTFSWEYQSLKPASAEGTPIRMAAHMDKDSAQDGETVHVKVTVENKAAKGQGMVVAIVGLPAGLELPPNFEQLRTYAKLRNNGTEAGLISAFELRGRELVLYWRQMAPEQKIEVNLDLICRVPGDYRGPAGRAYLYYNADTKHWIDPIQMAVAPKK